MKKTISLIMMLVLITTFAFAQGNGNGVMAQEHEPILVQEHASIQGLEEALIQVRTQEQAQHIEQVMEQIQERHRLRLNELDDLTFEENEDGNVMAQGVGTGKFLGLLNLRYRYEYRVLESGQLTRVRKPFDFLFTDLDNQLEGVE